MKYVSLFAIGLFAACGLGPVEEAPLVPPDVEWARHGRTDAEQRYSPLDQINTENVDQLGLAWSFDLMSDRGVESTPLVVDGRMFVTAPWSVVHALDARTGERLWSYDPEVPRGMARDICCGVVNRGVAYHAGRVFVGTLDGRLIALDAATGAVAWDVDTREPDWAYSITGAPRVVEGLVVIGNAGADLGARGYVSAYHADSGALAWRTYTVPGNPENGFESEAMARAAETWTGEWWKAGGGGTVWDALAYDSELGLLYVGTGNGTPHVRWLRSPDGGDNLYLSSILALRPQTGELVWHYQTTPGDSWDYTATQHILLAELEIDGRERKVLMQAPKNGFFFVIDRETGEFLSAEKFTEATWASHVDENGRPVETDTDYREVAKFVRPSPYGAHSWPPMSFHPKTGLVYFPVRNMGSVYKMNPDWDYRPGTWNTGIDMAVYEKFGSSDDYERWEAFLLAWDPVAQKEVWRVPHITAFNGGTLSTGDDLLFEGSADGRFVAYRASTGEKLWESPVGTGVMAAPITYRLDGEQYVAVAAGWGASFAMSGGEAALLAKVRGGGRVLAWKLGGDAEIPPGRPPLGPVPPPTYALDSTQEERRLGAIRYQEHCGACHGPGGVGGGSGVPDLRYLNAATHALFPRILLEGLLEPAGMPRFDEFLSPAEVRAIQAFLLEQARRASQKYDAPGSVGAFPPRAQSAANTRPPATRSRCRRSTLRHDVSIFEWVAFRETALLGLHQENTMDWNALFEQLSSNLGETLPMLAGALGLLAVGWLAALVVRAVIRGVLTRVGLNDRIAASTGNESDIAGGIAKGAYYLVFLIALVAVFNVLEIEYASASLQSLVDQVLAFVPRAIAAGVLLGVAWLLAVILRAGVTRALAATTLDERLAGEAGMRPLSESLGNVLYGLVFLLFLPGILGALEMEGLLAPVQGMLDQMLGHLPNVFGAAVIGAVGVFVARIVRDLVTNLLAATGLDRVGQNAGLQGTMALSGLLGLVTYVFILVPAMIAALNALQIDAISGPATQMLGTFMSALPNVFAAAIILGIAWLVAGLLSSLATNLLGGLGFDALPARLGLSEAASGGVTPSDWTGRAIGFFVMLFAVTEAANRLGFEQVSAIVATLIGFAGQVLLGGVIIAAGVWIANLVHAAMSRVSGDAGAPMAGVARFAILGLVGAMGLRAMGLADDIVNLAFGLVLGALAVAFALSFGLGGREAAGEHMQHWLRRLRSE